MARDVNKLQACNAPGLDQAGAQHSQSPKRPNTNGDSFNVVPNEDPVCPLVHTYQKSTGSLPAAVTEPFSGAGDENMTAGP